MLDRNIMTRLHEFDKNFLLMRQADFVNNIDSIQNANLKAIDISEAILINSKLAALSLCFSEFVREYLDNIEG